MAKRRQGSQSQPAPAERQGGVLAKNSGPFFTLHRLVVIHFAEKKAEMIVISLHHFLWRTSRLYEQMVIKRRNNKADILVTEV
jgi:hypothetical protein